MKIMNYYAFNSVLGNKYDVYSHKLHSKQLSIGQTGNSTKEVQT
jgi:hypothetical protein